MTRMIIFKTTGNPRYSWDYQERYPLEERPAVIQDCLMWKSHSGALVLCHQVVLARQRHEHYRMLVEGGGR